jgi:glycoside/pentoside/hexuronide:cation symporter, GPH family
MTAVPSKSPKGSFSPVPEKDRVPFWQKVAYGLGGMLEVPAVWIPQQNLTPVFNIAMGMNPALLGTVLMIWRIWDGVFDQIMGTVSDNARTPWGRRSPFIVFGAIFAGLTLPIIWWMPEALGEWQKFTWLLVGGLIFYSFYSIWAMPYYSFQLEMSPDYNERTNITAYRAYAQHLIGITMGWILAVAALPLFSRFPDHHPDLINGMRYLSVFLAVGTIVIGVLPGLFVKERFYAKETSKQAQQKMLEGLKQTLTTAPFLWLIIITFTETFGFGLIGVVGFYLNTYYICKGDLVFSTTITGAVSTLLFVPSLLFIPLCTWIAGRWDKQTLLYITTVFAILGSLSAYLFMTPAHPWFQLIPPLLTGPVSVGLWLVVPSMQGDVADYDELFTGKRREGSFTAVYSWTNKVAWAVTGAAGGVLLNLTGFRIEQGVNQPAHVLENLKLFYIWTPIIFLIISLFAISRYTLSRERMKEIRDQLEARRGVI